MKGYNAGLKIRASAMHQSAATRNILVLIGLALVPSAGGCTTMQQSEANPALNFGVSRFVVGPAPNQ